MKIPIRKAHRPPHKIAEYDVNYFVDIFTRLELHPFFTIPDVLCKRRLFSMNKFNTKHRKLKDRWNTTKLPSTINVIISSFGCERKIVYYPTLHVK